MLVMVFWHIGLNLDYTDLVSAVQKVVSSPYYFSQSFEQPELLILNLDK